MKSILLITGAAVSCEIKQSQIQVEVILKDVVKSVSGYFSLSKVKEWLPQEYTEKYEISVSPLRIKFCCRQVFGDIDHAPLVSRVKAQLDSLCFNRISYDFQGYAKIVRRQVKAIQNYFLTMKSEQPAQKRGQGEIYFLSYLADKETIQTSLETLHQYYSEDLVYPLDQQLYRMRISQQDYGQFIRGIVHHFEESLKRYIYHRLARIGLEDEVVIKSIKKDYYHDFKNKVGIKISLIGLERAFGKLYQIVERWFQKFNWVIAQVDRIQCCRKDKLVEWFKEEHQHRVFILSSKHNVERVVVYCPKKDRQHFEKVLRVATRIITGREFGQSYVLIYKYKIQFKKFIAGEKIGESDLKIYQTFLIFQGDPNIQSVFRRKIKEFLELYNEEQVHIDFFKSRFHIAILRNFYRSMIKTKPTTLQIIDGKLFSRNPKKLSEFADAQLRDIHQHMHKELVYKPLLRPLPKLVDYFDVKQAPAQWTSLQSLDGRRYKFGDKLTIYLRSYGSIVNGNSNCHFFVSEVERCKELRDIVQGQGNKISQNFIKNLTKNTSLMMQLRLSKYFDKIHICYLKNQRRGKFQSRAIQMKGKQFIEQLVEDSNQSEEIKIFLSTDFQLIEFVLQNLLQNILQSVKFSPEIKKQLTIYNCVQEGDKNRKRIVDFLKNFKFQDKKINRITDFDLRIPQMERIIEYRFSDLKYFENEINRTATPMNSFIFQRQYKKQTKTPIFLYSSQQLSKSKYNEYLVSCFDWSVYEIKKDLVVKLRQKCEKYEGLHRLCNLVKKYFPYVDWLVLYGDVQKDEFIKKFAYTNTSQDLYKLFKFITIDETTEQLMVKENIGPVKYEVVPNKYLKYYRVETHPDKLEELRQLKKCTSLA